MGAGEGEMGPPIPGIGGIELPRGTGETTDWVSGNGGGVGSVLMRLGADSTGGDCDAIAPRTAGAAAGVPPSPPLLISLAFRFFVRGKYLRRAVRRG